MQRKPGTTRGSPKRSRNGEGIPYKSQGDEVGVCLRVGRMGPNKCRWTRTAQPGPERGPLEQSDARRSHGGVPPSRWPPTQSGEPMLPRRARRMEANLLHATGMLGDSLTEARSGKAHLIGQLWSRTEGKPTVRKLRPVRLVCSAGDRPAGARVRSPVVWMAGWRGCPKSPRS